MPGLQQVKARLPQSTGDDIVSLVHATQEAQTRLLLLVDPVVVNQGERARAVINELESALELLLDGLTPCLVGHGLDRTEVVDVQIARLLLGYRSRGPRHHRDDPLAPVDEVPVLDSAGRGVRRALIHLTDIHGDIVASAYRLDVPALSAGLCQS
ncbi:MAG: hypothetical protein ACMG6S_35695 [Byssovorax sp.]